LAVGDAVPDLAGVDQNAQIRRLADNRGRLLVVYFYPRDETPGCTREACAFRDVWRRYQRADIQLLGVSRDSQASHARFAAHHQLPFPLIADPDGVRAKAFGVRTFSGLDARMSFLVARDGKVARVYPQVDPGLHAEQVLLDAAGVKN
jgi:peroxiredoxin Q/BCP